MALGPNTKVFYMETICNQMMGVSDIPAPAENNSANGVMLFVDSTLITGGLIRLSAGIEPLETVREGVSNALDPLDQSNRISSREE